MKTTIPASPGFSVLFADMKSITDVLADNPKASIGDYVGCQTVIAWEIEDRNFLPLTYNQVELHSRHYEYRVLEETDRVTLEQKRVKWVQSIYSDLVHEKGQAG